jgi:hypothetical protein
MVHFVPTHTSIDAPGVAELYFNTVFRLHGLSRKIISDRDPRFTSNFWQALNKLLDTKLGMSTSYHPQADGQSERTNRTLEDILRAFVSTRQTNWDQFLAAAEFAINNSWHQAIGNTPFFVNSGRHPTTPAQLATFQQGFTTNAAVEDIIQNIHAAVQEVSRHTQKAQAKQKSQADKSRRDVSFHIGDKVLLSTQDLKLAGSGPAHKLRDKYMGPFTVTKQVTPVTYELELPHILKVHPVFHVSKLKAYNDGSVHFPFRHEHIRNRQKPAFYQDGEPHYIAEAIVKHRRRGNTVEFLVKWQGFELHENEWGRAENLRHLDVFQEYIRSHPDLASRPCFRRPSG